MFDQVFAGLAKQVPEIRMAGVWGTDGLELEKRIFSPLQVEVDFLGAEVADIVTRINGIQPAPDSARVRLELAGSRLYVYRVTRDFFLILLVDAAVIEGRLNFYADLCAASLAQLL